MAYFKGQHRAVSACCWRKRSGWRVVLQAATRVRAHLPELLTFGSLLRAVFISLTVVVVYTNEEACR